jgi:hypothetical protein
MILHFAFPDSALLKICGSIAFTLIRVESKCLRQYPDAVFLLGPLPLLLAHWLREAALPKPSGRRLLFWEPRSEFTRMLNTFLIG